MDLNPGRAAFNRNFVHEELREPRIYDNSGLSATSNAPARVTSMLSVNAPEFVPRSIRSATINTNSIAAGNVGPLSGQIRSMHISSNSVQDRLNVRSHPHPHHLQHPQNYMDRNQTSIHKYDRNHGTLNQFANEFQNYPAAQNNYMAAQKKEQYVKPAVLNAPSASTFECDVRSPKPTDEELFAINYIHTIVNCLNQNPGSYDPIATRAANVFEGFGNNHYVLSNAMEIIFDRSIEEQNFRYMGAKLYGLLDNIILRNDSLFRTLLNLKLSYHQSEIMNRKHDETKVRGTTLFLAELYMQLRNDGYTIKSLATHIVFLINQLLNNTTPDNIKCICLTLKLAGYDIEKDCPQEICSIMNKLLVTSKHLDLRTSRLVENVLALKKNQWGRKPETFESTSLEVNGGTSMRNNDGPVFYGPDGEILSEEENAFLTTNIATNQSYEDDNDSDFEYDAEMDAEAEVAYEDFLKYSAN